MIGVTVTTAKGNTFDISDLIAGAIVSWSYDDDGNVTNGSVTLAIGDYVNYDPTNYDGYAEDADTATYTSEADVNGYGEQKFKISSYTYGWRVLGADEGTGELLLISDDFICPYSGGYDATSSYNRTYFRLKGQAGYANCESELNAICAIFGNGYGATGARSINVDDINKITGYDPDTAAYGSGYIYAYGNEVTYTYNTSSKTDYSWSGGSGTGSYSFTYYTGTAWKTLASGEDVTLTNTYYYYYPNTLTTSSSGETAGISTTSTEYYMLFTNSSTGAYSGGANTTSGFYYWLASPCVACSFGYANFYCRYVYSGYVPSNALCSSGGNAHATCYGVRAAVSLRSDVSLEWNDTTSKWEIQ